MKTFHISFERKGNLLHVTIRRNGSMRSDFGQFQTEIDACKWIAWFLESQL